MAKLMNRKIIISGHVVEVYEYEKPVFYDFKSKGGRKKDGEEGSKRREENRKTAAYRAREKLRRLILANFDENSKFVTLTFRDGEVEDLGDVEQTNPLFKKFIMRLKYHVKKDLRYAAVIEFQDKNGRGAVHYHMICDLDFLPHEELERIWGHGFVKINSLKARMREDGRDVDNVGAYMIKYMLKDLDDDRLRGKKAYLTSRNLKKPKELKGTEAEAYWYLNKLDEKETVFTSEYESEHYGKVQYKEFNPKRHR